MKQETYKTFTFFTFKFFSVVKVMYLINHCLVLTSLDNKIQIKQSNQFVVLSAGGYEGLRLIVRGDYTHSDSLQISAPASFTLPQIKFSTSNLLHSLMSSR